MQTTAVESDGRHAKMRSTSASRTVTRPPSPGDDFSMLVHPTREDEDELRSHLELYERMRSRVSVDVPGCAPFTHSRSQSKASKNILPKWLFTGCVGWISGVGQTGSAILPFITGLLASKFGISSLQPL